MEKTPKTGSGFQNSRRVRRISENRSENTDLLITISVYVKKCKKIPPIIAKKENL